MFISILLFLIFIALFLYNFPSHQILSCADYKIFPISTFAITLWDIAYKYSLKHTPTFIPYSQKPVFRLLWWCIMYFVNWQNWLLNKFVNQIDLLSLVKHSVMPTSRTKYIFWFPFGYYLDPQVRFYTCNDLRHQILR